ncbi:hypothetical protein C0Q70_21441 [Pomacea canaliculata]|uniref:Uncharacterized protein n=1 Tax=Pomacea canaliculata TaxID=400727 RepID=A0A2T7NCI3_POMCA|nr:hypothetical protein C0Q70_21441 [Pomacea canaliculata]
MRYVFVFFNLGNCLSMMVTAVTLQLLYAFTAAMYILARWNMSRSFLELLKHLQAFEATYGMTIDYGKVRKVIVSRFVFFISFLFAFTFGFITTALTFFPSLKIHLSPFQNVDGGALYGILIVHALFLYLAGAFVFFQQALLGLMTYILKEEFRGVSNSLRDLLSCHPEPSDRKASQNAIQVITIQVAESTFQDCSTTLKDSTTLANRKVGGNFLTHPHSSNDHQDGGDNLPKNNGDGFTSRSARVPEAAAATSSGTPDPKTMEEMFDEAVYKHRTLCQIVEHTNTCLRHILGFSFLATLPVVFLTLYTFINGGIDLGNLLFNVYSFFSAITFEAIGVRVGTPPQSAQKREDIHTLVRDVVK